MQHVAVTRLVSMVPEASGSTGKGRAIFGLSMWGAGASKMRLRSKLVRVDQSDSISALGYAYCEHGIVNDHRGRCTMAAIFNSLFGVPESRMQSPPAL